jgi:hypothetical protein
MEEIKITEREVRKRIKKLRKDAAPGPEVFAQDFYSNLKIPWPSLLRFSSTNL